MCGIRSDEHDTSKTPAKANPLAPSATTRTQSMAETSNSPRHILERIRDDAEQALNFLGESRESRSLAWECSGCGYVKHFTRPAPAEVAAPCPKCAGGSFRTF